MDKLTPLLTGSKDPVNKNSPARERNRAALLFPVKKVEVPGLSLSHCAYDVIVDTPKGDLRVNSCSKGYSLVPLEELLIPFEEKMDASFNYDVIYRHKDHSQFFIDYIIDHPLTFGEDTIKPKIRVNHSYTGTLKFTFLFGAYRLICSNGLIIAEEEITRIIRKHTLNFDGEATGLRMIGAIQSGLAKWPEMQKQVEVLSDMPVGNFTKTFKKIATKVDFPTSLSSQVRERMLYEVGRLGTDNNLWLLYNSMNYQLNHNDTSLRMQETNRQKVDMKLNKHFADEVKLILS